MSTENLRTAPYEIAYLLHPDIAPEATVTIAGNITKIIEKAGGTVQFVAEPKKRKLSFSIFKVMQAYFGYTASLIAPSSIMAIKKALTEEKNILRFLIVHVPKPYSQAKERVFTARSSFRRELENSPLLSDRPLRQTPGSISPQLKEKVDVEEIDKKLEEILNK